MAAALPLNASAILGPDAFGYFATGAPFNFVDITGTGTRILPASDDGTVTVDLGFQFSSTGPGTARPASARTACWRSADAILPPRTPTWPPPARSTTCPHSRRCGTLC